MGDGLSAWIARIGAPAFRRVYRFDRALRSKLTPAGWLVAGTLVVTMIFGLNTREAAVYQLFGLMVGLLGVASIAAFRLRLAPRVERELPEVATAGVPFEYTIKVASGARTPYDQLVVEDVLELPPADARAFARYKVSADRSRNLFDRPRGLPALGGVHARAHRRAHRARADRVARAGRGAQSRACAARRCAAA
jgi:hypothetical protein